jgi:hypothetical protein
LGTVGCRSLFSSQYFFGKIQKSDFWDLIFETLLELLLVGHEHTLLGITLEARINNMVLQKK